MTETTTAHKPGDRMDDGSVFAGSLNGRDILTTPEDAALTYTFNDAVEYAAKLNRQKYLGHNDWRVPTQDELNMLWENRNEGALEGTFNVAGSNTAGWYWSSRVFCECAWAQRFSDGMQLNDHYEDTVSSLRLVC